MINGSQSVIVVAVVAAVLVSAHLAYRNPESMNVSKILSPLIPQPAPASPIVTAEPLQPATSGRLFKGAAVATFNKGEAKFASGFKAIPVSKPKQFDSPCKHWSVCTTIFEATEAVIKQAKLEGWCFVVAGDRKTPPGAYSEFTNKSDSRLVFLSDHHQEELAKTYEFVNHLHWNSFSRKNVGYLYAILNGAETIWDFDDDNLLISDSTKFSIPGFGEFEYDRSMVGTVDVYEVTGLQYIGFNPYPVMGATTTPCWPRGYPLDHIKDEEDKIKFIKTSVNVSSIGIVQSLADHDPDVDAIYRLTQPLPFTFNVNNSRLSEARPVAIPADRFAPYNAQATLHLYSSFWSMLLPITVHGRVADIWRGYLFQRLAQDVGIRLLMSPSMVAQNRNSHSYLADFDSEDQLYKRSGRLIEQLSEWKGTTNTFPGRIEELWIFMYEHGYFARSDVYLVQSWLQTLLNVGYQFPELIK